METGKPDGRSGDRHFVPVLPLLKRHEVQVLCRAGIDQKEVARLSGVSARSVTRIAQETPVAELDTAAEVARRKIGRPSKAEPLRGFVVETLATEPEVMSLELLRRARHRGYSGSKTAFYALVAGVRPRDDRPMVRFEGLPGEFSQHDFGEVDVTFIDGRKVHVEFFASRLKYSRWVQVTRVPNQRVEPLVRTLVEHFDAIGGVSLVAVFDRPKTIVHKWRGDGTVTEWNATFAQVLLELGVGVELCWPRSGNQKGSVERLVGWVKNSFFKQRRFIDEEDLDRQLAEWHLEVNTKTVSRATGVTPAERMREERPRLRALKVSPAALALRYPVAVGPTGVVFHDEVPYSMPPDAIGLPATLFLHRDHVRIVAGRFSVIHDRKYAPSEGSFLPEHRAQMVAAVSGKRAKRYYKREQLLRLGKETHAFLTELVHRRPRTWASDVDALFELLQAHGTDALQRATGLALAERTFGAEYVRHFLLGAPAPGAWARDRDDHAEVAGDGAQPRGRCGEQLALGFGRAEPATMVTP